MNGLLTIGSGALVAVVGPSGAGKDTLIALVRDACAQDAQLAPRIIFPRRIVTRPASIAEEHDSATNAEFAAALGRGAYAFWWEAHGLKYALPIAIDIDLRAGHAVVCNVSRAVVGELRERYAKVVVILVTAPKDVLLARLAARGRESDLAARLDRAVVSEDDLAPDTVIENVGDPQLGARRLAEVLRREAGTRVG